MVFCDRSMAMGMGMNGYTFGPKPEDGCFIFLYKDYVIDTEAKYAGLIIAMLILGTVSELLREAKLVYCTHWFFQSDLWSSVYLAFQMGFSYTLMLLVMLFDFGVVVSACVGLGFGHYLGRKWRRSHERSEKSLRAPTYEDATETDGLLYSGHKAGRGTVNGCGDKVEAPKALDTTPCCRV
eukprot:m.26728 g.26728  ORF g.26728 m.26728 type:complete len:181 (-) comp6348_c0_seq2:181-723(-)